MATTDTPAPLLPTREELQPGAENVARALLAALSEISMVVVDEGRARAILADAMASLRQDAARETAGTCATLLDKAAAGVVSLIAQGAMLGSAALIRRGYGLPEPSEGGQS